MSKLKLDVEALSVQTFQVESRKPERGTVIGRETDFNGSCACEPSIDYPVDTCGLTCFTNCGSGCISRCPTCTEPLCCFGE